MSVSMQRVCVRCGRVGVQQYISARQDGTPAVSGEGWVCANERACRQRAAARDASWPCPTAAAVQRLGANT